MKLPMTAMAPSTPAEQSITAFTLAEIMTDPDTGQRVFCVATDEHLSDFQAVTAEHGFAAAEAVHKKADEIAELAHRWKLTGGTLPAYDDNEQLTDTGRRAFDLAAEQLNQAMAKATDPAAFYAAWKSRMTEEIKVLLAHYSVPHHPWCEPGACITVDGDDGPAVEHQGRRAELPAPADVEAARGNLVDAHLYASSNDVPSVPVVSIVSATGNGKILQPDELDQLIDDTTSFLNQLRAMRLHVKEAQA